MARGVRNLALLAHVTSSVGWFGAVAGFFALAIIGLTGVDTQTVRGAYIALELIGWLVIVPFCLASLATGLVQSLITPWGLLRHYWVVAKLVIAVLATGLLTLHMRPVSYVAGIAAMTTLSPLDLRPMRIQLIADAAFAMVALTVATALSIYKPQGLTPYGRRLTASRTVVADTEPWAYAAGIALLVMTLLFILVHLAGVGLGRHGQL
jgi:hypothetical protein